ncbi:Rhomboid family protein [Symmachiella macrocystis]|uniref:Rhomboid family protein n=1 Tax=Symmachiella macrocystis TaxID=2527985 RepID=A0A5C6BJG0_9PLAN|nr:rhombosortase [Symmachiella macrocystis]TWU12150.1 Rhomboid family protein [Symmachiella macrocystis]
MFSETKKNAAVRCIPGISLLLGGVAVCLSFLPAIASQLQFEPSAIAAGQLWRIVTCHFTHWSLDHLIWDALAFVILAALCETTNRRSFLGCLTASAVLIPLCIDLLMPEVDAYRGLSGIDSALFVLSATTILRENVTTRRWGWVAAVGIVLCGFAAKIGFEYVTGQTLFVDSAAADMVPIPLAHVVGGLVGVGIGGWGWMSGGRFVGNRNGHVSRRQGIRLRIEG